MQDQSRLPPLPKLRPRPGLRPSQTGPADQTLDSEGGDRCAALKNRKKGNCAMIELDEKPNGESLTVLPVEAQEDSEEKTSRLLMKTECGRGGRRRNTGSLIHSIPKFTQVKPRGGQISEVQKVLQSRLLSRQMQKQQQNQQPPSPKIQTPSPLIYSAVKEDNLKASNILQSIISLHEMKASSSSSPSSTTLQTPKPLSVIASIGKDAQQTNNNSNGRRRGRKPDKSAICHVIAKEEDSTLKALLKPVMSRLSSEVTITPTSKRPQEAVLDLSSHQNRSPSPDVVEVAANRDSPDRMPLVPILQPDEYERLGMPPGYIFWPTANAFVHPSAIPNQFLDRRQTLATSVDRPAVSSGKPVIIDSLESLSGVMRVKPQRPVAPEVAADGVMIRKRPSASLDTNAEVSICKFKFTGGAKPTLEEKKMLSVDSGGNFRYYSGPSEGSNMNGTRSLRGVESLPREVMAANASTIVADRFTSMTAEKLAKASTGKRPSFHPASLPTSSAGGTPLAAFDLISAFDALPDCGERPYKH